MGLLAYAIAGIALIGALGGLYFKVHNDGYQQGKFEVKSEWDLANQKAEDEAKAIRKAQEAERAKQEAALSRRLSNERKRATALQDQLSEALRGGTDCKLPDGVQRIWNESHQAGEGKPPAGVPEGSRKPTPPN